MLLNDSLGDCAAARARNVAQQVNWYGRDQSAPGSDPDTLAVYEAISGYVPGEPSTDAISPQTPCRAVGRDRRDVSGTRHPPVSSTHERNASTMTI
jgi:hypothetical protein